MYNYTNYVFDNFYCQFNIFVTQIPLEFCNVSLRKEGHHLLSVYLLRLILTIFTHQYMVDNKKQNIDNGYN